MYHFIVFYGTSKIKEKKKEKKYSTNNIAFVCTNNNTTLRSNFLLCAPTNLCIYTYNNKKARILDTVSVMSSKLVYASLSQDMRENWHKTAFVTHHHHHSVHSLATHHTTPPPPPWPPTREMKSCSRSSKTTNCWSCKTWFATSHVNASTDVWAPQEPPSASPRQHACSSAPTASSRPPRLSARLTSVLLRRKRIMLNCSSWYASVTFFLIPFVFYFFSFFYHFEWFQLVSIGFSTRLRSL